MPYDRFMEAEGIPVHRAIGVHRGARPADEAVEAPRRTRHLHPALRHRRPVGHVCRRDPARRRAQAREAHVREGVFVVEGRGSTEVWNEGQTKKQTFEWQKGSLFAIPLNAYHRFVNASNSPALMLCGTTAPNMMNLVDNAHFVFNCPYNFTDRYSGDDDYFKPKDDLEPDPVRGLAMRRTNFIPDIINCEMPLDNRRSPGYRRIEPHMGAQRFYLWIGQHETGRYSKAHAHEIRRDADLPEGQGLHLHLARRPRHAPWKDGKADKVMRQDYEFGGMVSAAPMSGDWFHQHFGVSKDPLRFTAWFGANNHSARKPGRPGEAMADIWAIDIKKGGSAIPYNEEDPCIRKEFEETLARGRRAVADGREVVCEGLIGVAPSPALAGEGASIRIVLARRRSATWQSI